MVNSRGKEILDSRGNPTAEADVFFAHAIKGRAALPCGASRRKAFRQ